MTKLTFEQRTITSEQATAMMEKTKQHYAKLGRPHNFKPLNDNLVMMIAEDIEAGRWSINGEAIKLDSKGNVIDGQHRLEALGLCQGKSITTWVVTGVDDTMIMDAGRPRTLAHHLRNMGSKYYGVVSTIVRYVDVTDMDTGEFKMTSVRMRGSPAKHMKVFQKYEREIESAIDFVVSTQGGPSKGIMVMASSAYALMMARRSYDKNKMNKEDAIERANKFAYKVITGTEIAPSSSIYQLRKRLIANARSVTKLRQSEILALTCKAWHYYVDGTPCEILAYRDTEGFPNWGFDAESPVKGKRGGREPSKERAKKDKEAAMS